MPGSERPRGVGSDSEVGGRRHAGSRVTFMGHRALSSARQITNRNPFGHSFNHLPQRGKGEAQNLMGQATGGRPGQLCLWVEFRPLGSQVAPQGVSPEVALERSLPPLVPLEVGGSLSPDCLGTSGPAPGPPRLRPLCDQEAKPRLPGSRLGPSLFWGPTHPLCQAAHLPACSQIHFPALTGIPRGSISQPCGLGQRRPRMEGRKEGAVPSARSLSRRPRWGCPGNATPCGFLSPRAIPQDERAAEPRE